MKIKVSLYYHLKEKTGTGKLEFNLPEATTIKDLKSRMETDFPALRTHLDNIMILMDNKIVLDEDKLKNNVEVAFLTPVGGG